MSAGIREASFIERYFYNDFQLTRPNYEDHRKSWQNFSEALGNLDKTAGVVAPSLKFFKWLNDSNSKPLKWQSSTGESLTLSTKDAKSAVRDHKMATIASVITAIAFVVLLIAAIACPGSIFFVVAISVLKASTVGLVLAMTKCTFTKYVKVEAPPSPPMLASDSESETARLLDQRQDDDVLRVQKNTELTKK